MQGTECPQTSALGKRTALRCCIAWLAQVIIACSRKSDLVPLLKVHTTEPLECAVLRHYFDQRFEKRIVEAVIARLMGMGNDHDVGWIVLSTESLVEFRQCPMGSRRNPVPTFGATEKNVVMTPLRISYCPFLAEKSNEFTVD